MEVGGGGGVEMAVAKIQKKSGIRALNEMTVDEHEPEWHKK